MTEIKNIDDLGNLSCNKLIMLAMKLQEMFFNAELNGIIDCFDSYKLGFVVLGLETFQSKYYHYINKTANKDHYIEEVELTDYIFTKYNLYREYDF